MNHSWRVQLLPAALRESERFRLVDKLSWHEADMIDQAKPVSRPWRRFLRFSVWGTIAICAGDRRVAWLDR